MSFAAAQATAAKTGQEALIVLRHGELFLKGGNRRRFENALEENVRRAIVDLHGVVSERAQGRVYLAAPANATPVILRRLHWIPGISSYSLAVSAPRDLPALRQLAIETVRIESLRTQSFRVHTRRADKRFALTSMELNAELGSAIAAATGLQVDLEKPDITLRVEIGVRRSFIEIERWPGCGGLPVGGSAPIVLLLSGGIDSPVAGHLMQKRGCRLHLLYFHSPPYTSEHARDKVMQLAARLARGQGTIHLEVVPFTDIQKNIRDCAPPKLSVLLYRRRMMEIASRRGTAHDCGAIATGESLGQVASQTAENLACIEDAATLPIFRPLIAFDKEETIRLARQIGTYDISILPHADCCSLFVPKHPATRCTVEALRTAEEQLDPRLIDQATADLEEIEIPPAP